MNDFIELGKFFFELPDYEVSLLVWKNGSAADVLPILKDLQRKLSAISPENFENREVLSSAVQEVIENIKKSLSHPAFAAASAKQARESSPIDADSRQPEAGSRANRGDVLWPLRVALSGQQSSPDPLDIMGVLGKEESLARIKKAIKRIVSSRA